MSEAGSRQHIAPIGISRSYPATQFGKIAFTQLQNCEMDAFQSIFVRALEAVQIVAALIRKPPGDFLRPVGGKYLSNFSPRGFTNRFFIATRFFLKK